MGLTWAQRAAWAGRGIDWWEEAPALPLARRWGAPSGAARAPHSPPRRPGDLSSLLPDMAAPFAKRSPHPHHLSSFPRLPRESLWAGCSPRCDIPRSRGGAKCRPGSSDGGFPPGGLRLGLATAGCVEREGGLGHAAVSTLVCPVYSQQPLPLRGTRLETRPAWPSASTEAMGQGLGVPLTAPPQPEQLPARRLR